MLVAIGAGEGSSRGFVVASEAAPAGDPYYVMGPDGICRSASDEVLPLEEIALGLRTCGVRLDAEHALLTGAYTASGRMAERLLGALPRVLVVPQPSSSAPVALLEQEITREEPGQQAVLDRLLDLVLLSTLRDWCALPETEAPRWWRPHGGISSAPGRLCESLCLQRRVSAGVRYAPQPLREGRRLASRARSTEDLQRQGCQCDEGDARQGCRQ